MHTTTDEVRRVLIVVAASVVIVWGAMGLYLNAQLGYNPGLYGPDYMVPAVREGTGLQAGDRVISVEGLPVEKLGMEPHWPRALVPRAGESRRFLVARKGEHVLIDVVYGPPPASTMSTRFGAGLIGLAFLLPALWAYLGARSGSAVKLAQIAFATGLAVSFGLGPNLGWWTAIQDHLAVAATVLAGVLLLQFSLMFPKTKRASQSRIVRWGIFVPWAGLLGAFVVELILHPVLYHRIGWVPDVLMLAYVLLAVAAMTHSIFTMSRDELIASGLHLIVAGFFAAIFATAAAVALGVPGWVYGATLLPAPLSLAVAVRKDAVAHSSAHVLGGAPA